MKLTDLKLALVSRARNPIGFARTAGVPVPFLDYALCPINFDEYEVSDEEALQVVGAFLQLANADRLRLSPEVHAHYTECVNAMRTEYDDEADLLGGNAPPTSPEDVWRLVTGSDLLVRKENGILYVLVVSDCHWDLDHGVCMIFRQGKDLVRVGDLNCEPLEPAYPSDPAGTAEFKTLGTSQVLSYEIM